MHMMKLIVIVLAAMIVGCSGGASRTYDITVENRTQHTITLWLTKDGPPEEQGWLSPEQVSKHRLDREEPKYDMASVPPGRKAETGKQTGHFAGGTNAVLRVYDGMPNVGEILNGDRERDRVDYILEPGKNNLAVVDRDGKLNVLKE